MQALPSHKISYEALNGSNPLRSAHQIAPAVSLVVLELHLSLLQSLQVVQTGVPN